MAYSFPHRFAQVFREVKREQPAMPLEDQFRLSHHRLHEHKINNLLAQLHYLPSPPNSAPPSRAW
jgi:hypothetical protein